MLHRGQRFEVMYVKSMNVKKIAAVAGAALLAVSGVAMAALTFGTTPLVDDTGAPRVSVVVGTNAAASDGVAAARIAARIASATYQTKTYTPTVSGGTCAAAGEGEAVGGECDVIDKWVTLKFTAPGLSGAYEFEANIHDYLDNYLTNRVDNQTEDMFDFEDGDERWEYANPWTDGSDTFVSNNHLDEEAILRIDGVAFSPFRDYTISYPASRASKTYTQKTAAYVVGSTEFDTSEYELITVIDSLAYGVHFYGTDYGIPVCAANPVNDDWTGCPAGKDKTGEKRVKIEVLGEEWIITEMVAPEVGSSIAQCNLTQNEFRCSGGSVTLAKESDRKIMQLGDTIGLSAGYELKLTDIGVAETAGNCHAALFDIVDSTTGEPLEYQDANIKKIFPSDCDGPSDCVGCFDGIEEWDVPGTDDTTRVKVYHTTYGYELFQRWAEVSILAELWKLQDNKILHTTNDNKEWTAALIWKNKDATEDRSDPDSLRSIIFYSTKYGRNDIELYEGDTVPLLYEDKNQVYALTYHGLDLTADDYEPLTFSYKSNVRSFNFCDDSRPNAKTVSGFYIESGTSSQRLLGKVAVDEYTGHLSNGATTATNKIFVVTGGENITDANLESTENAGRIGEIYMWYETSSQSCWRYYSPGENHTDTDVVVEIPYKTAGSDGMITLAFDDFELSGGDVTDPMDYVLINVTENAGKVINDNAMDILSFAFNVSDEEFGPTWDDIDDDEIIYYAVHNDDGVAPLAARTVNEGSFGQGELITDRGSEIKTFTRTGSDVVFDIAKRVGMMQFSFSTLEGAADPHSTQETLREGESTVKGGVTIEVVEIDQILTSCGVGTGGAANCVFQNDAVATINGQSTLTVKQAVPGAVNPNNLIVMDSNAGSASVISVGGPVVNTVTQQLLTGVTYDFDKAPVIMEVEGTSSIVVAGKEAADTLQAANDFISQLVEN